MYNDQIKDKIIATVKLFFQYEQGNRVTIFNISGLFAKIDKDFKESVHIESKKGKKGDK